MKKKEEEAAKLAEIYVVVGEVENSKQVHLSEAERTSLAMDLFRLGESIEQIKRRGEAVKRNLTYGKISLDVWLSSEGLYSDGELNGMILQRIERRKEAYLKCRPDANNEELARQGLIEARLQWNNETRAIVEAVRDKHLRRWRTVRAQYFLLPQDAKNALWTIAVQKGFVKDGDIYAMQILPQLVDRMTSDFEEVIRNHSTKNESQTPNISH